MENKKKIKLGFATLVGAISIGLGITAISKNSGFALSSKGGAAYSITLDSSSKVTSDGDKVMKTKTGNDVTFTYSSVASSTTGHVTLNSGGYLVNKDQITSITAFACVYEGSGILKFKTAYSPDAGWNSETTVTSGQEYSIATSPYYLHLQAYNGSVTIKTLAIEYSCVANPTAETPVVEDEEQLLGVIDFWNSSSVGSWDANTLVNYSYVNERSYDNLNGTSKTLIANSSNNTYNYSYQGRMGGIGVGSNNNSSDLTLYFASGIAPTKFIVELASNGGDDSVTINDVSKTVTYDLADFTASTYNAASASITWEFDSEQDSISVVAGGSRARRTGLFRIYLYAVGAGASGPGVPEESLIGFRAALGNTDNYYTGDIFNNVSNLSVYEVYTGDTEKLISSGYTVTITDVNEQTVNPASSFTTEGEYTVTVSYQSFIPQTFHITVGLRKTIVSIAVNSTKLTYTTADTLDTSVITAEITYNGTYGKETVAYANFASKNVSLTLVKPDSSTASISSIFGTAGSWKIKVSSTSDASIFGELTITVNAIQVTDITVTGDATVEEGKTINLTANVTPNTVTNPTVSWTSSAPAVATVSSTGVVTGVSAGETTITASAIDGSGIYGTITITVTEKVVGADIGDYTLLDSEGGLTLGSYIIFASTDSGSGYAMSATQNTNNRPGVDVTISSSTITKTDSSSFSSFLVKSGTKSGTYAFYDEDSDGYLYAASSSNNQLKTEASLTDNSSWTVSSSNNPTITAQGSNTHNLLKWNTSAKVFSAYASGQANAYIFEKAGDPVYPTAISLSGDSSVAVGSTTTFTVGFTPSDTTIKSIQWSSDDDTIASVDDGVVTGIKAGTTTIRATGYGGITASKSITVNNVAVTGVTLNKSTISSLAVDATETLTATVSPSNATNKNVTWSTSDNSVAVVDDGVVRGVGAGTATITVTSVADSTKKATCTVTVVASGGSGGSGGGGTDTIVRSDTGITSTSYGTWTHTGSSGAVYSGQSAGGNSAIQLRATSPSGIVTTTSGGDIATITVSWNSNTNSRTLDVYGSNTAYSGPSDLYGNSAGTKLGSISSGSSTGTLTVTGSYAYVGVRSNSGALWIDSITFEYGSSTPTDPTSVTISPSSLELAAGRSQTLSLTYSQGANQNKAVSWSSSNENVATVDSSGKVTVKESASVGQTSTITARLTASGLTHIYDSITLTVIEQAKADQTILIYMCGSDLESGNGFATGDIEEILKVSGQPDDVNIVIETGGSTKWKKYNISASSLQRYHISNKSLVLDETLSTYSSMGLSSTFQSFLEYGLNEYPANRVGVIMWNHGGGMRGVCYDQKKSNDNLTSDEVKTAVSGALSNTGMTGQKLEWIGYDACLMQVQDIAEFNSAYFNYMVGSEESEAGYGWDYDNWVDDLFAKKTTTTILKAICDSFIADTDALYEDNGWGASDQTLSYLDLSYASAYKTAWENMASQITSKVSSNMTDFNTLVKGCKYYADTDYTYFGLFDAKDFINKLASSSKFKPDAYYTNAVLTAHGNLVVYSKKGSGAGNSYGLAMYWSAASDSGKSTYYKTSMTNFTNWRNIVINYGS